MKFSNFILNIFPEVKTRNHRNFNALIKWDEIDRASLNSIQSWPPNIFMILYSIIEYTDKYRLLVSPQEHFEWNYKNRAYLLQVVESLESYIDYQYGDLTHPNSLLIEKEINCIFNKKNINESIYVLMNDKSFCNSVFIVLISIDVAFKKKSGDFRASIERVLVKRKLRRRVNHDIKINSLENNLADNHAMEGIVAEKYNTPQSGLTINNLTQNLTCIKPAVKFHQILNKLSPSSNSDNYNVLFIPWPFVVNDDFFSEATSKNHDMDSYFGFFDYKPKSKMHPKEFLAYVNLAMKRVGNIDLIVFPESALSMDNFDRLKKALYEEFNKNSPSILSGIHDTKDGIGENYALLAFIDSTGSFDEIRQDKHHRWFLERNQLRNYNLSANLDPKMKWWENISISRRTLTTYYTTNGVSLCPLICEDLARQEPVAQAVRAIGPNLVVSLLLDGPQISSRWPGKYSAVLSDDPGSSVLSVTAFGMTQRSTGLGHKPSNQVALWSEPGKGSETLEVPSSNSAIVLELRIEDMDMWSLDGRCERKPILRKVMHTVIDIDRASFNSRGWYDKK